MKKRANLSFIMLLLDIEPKQDSKFPIPIRYRYTFIYEISVMNTRQNFSFSNTEVNLLLTAVLILNLNFDIKMLFRFKQLGDTLVSLMNAFQPIRFLYAVWLFFTFCELQLRPMGHFIGGHMICLTTRRKIP